MKHFVTLTRMRIQLTLRNKMFLFFGLIMPFGFFFLYAGVFAKGEPHAVKFFLGPVISLAVMGSFWGLSAALVTFREQGILRRFHVTPVTASDMLASSIVANYVLTLPTIALELLFARFIFHVSNFGNLPAFFILVTVGIVSFASMGLIVASVTNTMQETQVLNQLIWLPLIFLSGATMPLPYLPHVAQKFALFLPATYLVWGLQNATFFSQPIRSPSGRSSPFSLPRNFFAGNPNRRSRATQNSGPPPPLYLSCSSVSGKINKVSSCCSRRPPTWLFSTPKNTTNRRICRTNLPPLQTPRTKKNPIAALSERQSASN